MEVKGVTVLAGVDLAHQNIVTGVRQGQGLVGLVGEQAVVVALEQVREHAAVDEPDFGEAVRVGEVGDVPTLHLQVDFRVDFGQQRQKFLFVIRLGAVTIGAAASVGRVHDQRPQQAHLHVQAGVALTQAMVDVGAWLGSGEGVGHALVNIGRLGHQAWRTTAGVDVMTGHHDGHRLRHPDVGEVDGYCLTLSHDQRWPRVLGQVVTGALGVGGARAGIDVAEAPHLQAGALRQVHIERKGIQVEGGSGDAADVVGGLRPRPGQGKGQPQEEDTDQAPGLREYVCHCFHLLVRLGA